MTASRNKIISIGLTDRVGKTWDGGSASLTTLPLWAHQQTCSPLGYMETHGPNWRFKTSSRFAAFHPFFCVSIRYSDAMVLACTAAGSRVEKCISTPPSCNTVRE